MSFAKSIESQLAGPTPVIAGVAFVLVSLFVLYRRLLPKPLPGIPFDEASARKLLGDAPEMFREVSKTNEIQLWLKKKVNDIQQPLCQIFPVPFARPWVILADSIETQNLLTRRSEFDRSTHDKTGLSPLDGFHSRHSMGEDWKRTRNWIQDLASPNFINNVFCPVVYTNTFQMIDYWKIKARLANDRPFEVNRDLDHVAIDGIFALMFDERFEHAAITPQLELMAKIGPSDLGTGPKGEVTFPEAKWNPFVSAMYYTVEAVNYVTSSALPLAAKTYVRWIPRYSKAIKDRRSIIKDQTISAIKRLASGKEPKTALEHMLVREQRHAEKQGRAANLMNQILMDEVGGQFLAGYHTTSSTLSWMFIHLTRAQEVQKKLREIIFATYTDAYAEKRPPTFAEVSETRIPYLDAVIDEVLRLQATILSRIATRDTQVFGYHIPKGTTVFMLCSGPGFQQPTLKAAEPLRSAPSSGKAEQGWDESMDMSVFNPDRWLQKKDQNGNAEYDPNAAPQQAFGMGLRGCWGKRLAYPELRIILTLVMWHLEFLPVPKEMSYPSAGLSVIHRADECFIRLKLREDAVSSGKQG